METKDSDFIDEISCEEYYNEEFVRWLDEMEVEYVNGLLQLISEDEKELV